MTGEEFITSMIIWGAILIFAIITCSLWLWLLFIIFPLLILAYAEHPG